MRTIEEKRKHVCTPHGEVFCNICYPLIPDEVMTSEEYVSRNGHMCPWCGAENIKREPPVDASSIIFRDCVCGSCGEWWIETFTMSDITLWE